MLVKRRHAADGVAAGRALVDGHHRRRVMVVTISTIIVSIIGVVEVDGLCARVAAGGAAGGKGGGAV